MANLTLADWEKANDNTPLRVVFYGRVSTEHEAQIHALENQLQWYRDIASQNCNWTVVAPVETYLDEGITGTQAEKRPGFMKMISDAKNGCFDMIVTREVSRFGRNILDAISYCRGLKAIGVQVFFVSDGIRFIQDSEAEMRLGLMSTLAQEESRKISERVKVGQYTSRKKGVLYGTGNILGYERVKFRSEGQSSDAPTFRIVEKEAETVRRIFELYLQNYGLKKIKNVLIQEGRKTAMGKDTWSESTISRILDNPMYIGKQYQCKTKVVDFLSHDRQKNSKEDYVLVQGDFEPIIDEETFYRVQEIKGKRGEINPFKGETGASFTDDKWVAKLECECGSTFKRYKWHPKADGTTPMGYTCRNRAVNSSVEFREKHQMSTDGACNIKAIPAWHFELAGITAFSALLTDKREAVLNNFALIEKNFVANEKQSVRVDKTATERSNIEKYQRKLDRLLELYTDGEISKEEYASKRKEYEGRIRTAKEHIEQFAVENIDEDGEDTYYDALCNALNALISISDLSGDRISDILLKHYVDKVIVRSYGFDFLINLKGDAVEHVASLDVVRKNLPYPQRAALTEQTIEAQYHEAFFSILDFETARKFRKSNGNYLRTNQWDDLLVKVYIRK